ncbi:MAG TPA: peptide chain release factor N(5)-glutamine methyltransferase [Sediminispirochaeta sp.]|nr:peptide chain release factor N(5)-glutamine methyltransferase [Sediminispirochaeta sp.]
MSTVRELLVEATELLSELETPFLDATLILAHTLGVSREKILASYPEEIPLSAEHEFRSYLEKRRSGYPVSYIRQKKEFFGLPFYVDERVMVPRPETETLVELVLQDVETKLASQPRSMESSGAAGGGTAILDLGTGSGCIAISLKYLRPELEVHAADVSKSALAVCRQNSRHLLCDPLPLIESDFFSNIQGHYDIIVSNPPYVKNSEVAQMQQRRWPEPLQALDGGDDGLDSIRLIIEEAYDFLKPGGALFLETGIDQIQEVKDLLSHRGYRNAQAYQDLSGRDRVVSGRKTHVE